MLSVTDNQGRNVDYNKDTIFVFLDDTGHEDFCDPNYPIFGFGGCIFFAEYYANYLSPLWSNFKHKVLHISGPVHATDLRLTGQQPQLLGDFFRTEYFNRFAVLMKKPTNECALVSHEIIAQGTKEAIENVLPPGNKDKVLMFFESSVRCNMKVFNAFKTKGIGRKQDINSTQGYFVHKSQAEPGLELADLIIHSAGSAFNLLEDNNKIEDCQRRDFRSIFIDSQVAKSRIIIVK